MPQGDHAMFHYNILRTVRLEDQGEHKPTKVVLGAFSRDATLARFAAQCNGSVKALVLVCSRHELLQRVRARKHVEKRFDALGVKNDYNQPYWDFVYRYTDLAAVYHAWLNEMDRLGPRYTLVNSMSPDFDIISSRQEVDGIVNAGSM